MSKELSGSESESGHLGNSENVCKCSKKTKRPDKLLYKPPGKCKSVISESVSPSSTSKPTVDGACGTTRRDLPNGCDHNDKGDDLGWEALYDDSGEVVNQEVVNELNSELGIDLISDQLANSKLDYSKFDEEAGFDERSLDCGNILEIYDFAPDLQTRDLIACLSFILKNIDITWVDDTHALLVCATPHSATTALTHSFPILKLRPLDQGTKESKLKAKKLLETNLSKKPRPETTTLLARRLVTSALGIKEVKNPEYNRAEREKLRLAKEKKQRSLRQSKSVWED